MLDRLPDTMPVDADGVVLRLPRRDDIDALVAACQDPEIPRWTTIPSPYAKSDAAAFVAQVEEWRQSGDPRCKYVLSDSSGALFGMCGLVRTRPDDESGEVGYWLAPSARGRGLVTASLRALTGTMLRAGFERIEAEVLVGNDTSCRVLERVGFTHEGTIRSVASQGCGLNQDRIDIHVYSVIRRDPVAQELLR